MLIKKLLKEKNIFKFKQNFRVQQIRILKKIGSLSDNEIKLIDCLDQEFIEQNRDYHLIFKNRILSKKTTYDKNFNLLTKLLKNEKKSFFEKFFLNKKEFNSVNFKKKYVCWNFRHNTTWSQQFNLKDQEFLSIYNYMKKKFKDYHIMIISDLVGCNKAKQIAKKNNLQIFFSKNYSKDFLGDVELVLKSKFYLQFRSGGMLIVPIFSKLPYLIISYMSYFNVPFSKKKYISWQTNKQKRILDNNFSFFKKNNNFMKILFLSHSKAEQVDQIPNFIKTYGDQVITHFDKVDLNYVKEKKVEFIVCDRYEHLIKKDVIVYMKEKIINAHPSILPLNKGWQSNFWSVYHNTVKGVTIHFVDQGLDTGDIIAQQKINVTNSETLRNLYYKSRAAMINLFLIIGTILKKIKYIELNKYMKKERLITRKNLIQYFLFCQEVGILHLKRYLN